MGSESDVGESDIGESDVVAVLMEIVCYNKTN